MTMDGQVCVEDSRYCLREMNGISRVGFKSEIVEQATHVHAEEREKENKDPRFSCMKICGTVIARLALGSFNEHIRNKSIGI